jgi:acyl carrier protein
VTHMQEVTDTTEIEDRIRQFILVEILEVDEQAELPSDVSLISGLLDSFGLLSLLWFVEETYDISIDHSEVVDENFDSVEVVARLVARKMSASS